MPKDEKEKLVPNLRFKGFTDDWILYKLKDVSKRITRKNKEQIANIPLTISDKFGLIDQREYFTKKIASKDMSHYILLKKGEFAYNKSYSKKNIFGTVARLDNYDMGALSTLYIAFEVENADSTFIQKYYESDKWHYGISKIANEGARNHGLLNISTQDFFDTRIKTPNNLDEQTKIGIILEKLDNIITLEQEKLAHYKQIKMMLLSKLFATKENSVPEMRFKEFSEKWAQHELSEISSITMGQSPSSNNYTNNPNDYILVQGNADLENGKVIPRIWTTEVTKSVNKGAIILTVRAPVGDVAISHYEVVLGRGVAALTGNYFIYYLLIRMNATNYWRKYSTGSTFESINSSDIQRALIVVPSLDEQEKIGYTLNKIDKIITLEQTRIEHYQSIKNNLLHNLFI